MNKFNLDAYGVQEMSHQEMVEINGGGLLAELAGRAAAHILNAVDHVKAGVNYMLGNLQAGLNSLK